MKKILNVMMIVAYASVLLVPSAFAEWVNISQKLPEMNLWCSVSDPKDPKVIFLASDKRVYRTTDGGNSWVQVLALQTGDERLRSVYIDPVDPTQIYVCASKGIYRSRNQGKNWDLFFVVGADGTQKTFCLARDLTHSQLLWIGTDRGLIQMNEKTGQSHKVNGLPDAEVYSIFFNQPASPVKLIATSKGVYRNLSEGDSWERVFVSSSAQEEATESSVSHQFGVEEISAVPAFSNLIFSPVQDKFYAGTSRGVLQSTNNASAWQSFESSSLPGKKINFITRSQKTFYVATDRGVFQWDESARLFREIYLGLGSKEVRMLDYNAAGDYLLAATSKGAYRLQNPELSLLLPVNGEIRGDRSQDIFSHFSDEPTIQEVQRAAIYYAEVNPEKIEAWRKAASRKAWAPSLSFHQDFQNDENIDIDRGGTGDPDKFIKGPNERGASWYVTMSWNLADLIWNGDQTSIDSRSKLMVELRNDILSEVTHLYYERRRLQAEMWTAPAQDLKAQMENQIRLQELTSDIDALTGGYFSKSLGTIQGGALKI